MSLKMVGRHSALFRKLALNVEDFCIKTIGWGLKNLVFDHETQNSGLFPCYRLKINDFLSRLKINDFLSRLKINDFLSSYNQNLKIDIFTPLQQIPCY